MSELIRLFVLFVRFSNDLISSCRSSADSVGLPGFEPRMTGPESVVLPLHHSPIVVCECKSILFFYSDKENHKKNYNFVRKLTFGTLSEIINTIDKTIKLYEKH